MSTPKPPAIPQAAVLVCDLLNRRIERQRKRVITTAIIAVPVVVVIALLLQANVLSVLPVSLLPIAIVAQSASRDIKRFHKGTVIPRIIEALGEDLKYCEASTLDREMFKAFDLFNDRLDVFRSEDQVSGRCQDICYDVHEVYAAKREKKGKETEELVWFNGLIVQLDFNKNFRGHTVVIADRDSKLLGGWFGDADSRRGKSLVQIADPDFERVYSAYSTDDQEAHYILTPKLTQLMMETRARFGDVRFAFFMNSLFVTVPTGGNRFEAGLTTHVAPEDIVADLMGVLQLTDRLIDVLDLETRIWSRV